MVETFGELIRKRREQLNISLRSLADKCGVSPTYLSFIERDISPPPSENLIDKLSIVLDMSADDLMIKKNSIPSKEKKIILDNWDEVKEFLNLKKQSESKNEDH